MTMSRFAVLAVALQLLLPAVAQEQPMVMKLTVKHDGQNVPTPDQVTLSFNNRSVQVPVRDGRFEVPSEATWAQNVTFTAEIGDETIRMFKLPPEVLSLEDWTLLLAEKRYPPDYQWIVHKRRTNIRASCVLVLESVHADPGTGILNPHCRSKRK